MIIYDNCHCGLEECFDFIKIQSKKSKDLHRFTNVTDMTHLLKKNEDSLSIEYRYFKKSDLSKVVIFCCEILVNLPDVSVESIVNLGKSSFVIYIPEISANF